MFIPSSYDTGRSFVKPSVATQRPQHYSIQQEIPWQDRPLVRRRYRKGVPERLIPPHGEVLIPLDEAAVRTAARELKDAQVESIAVCFLFSYRNAGHENWARPPANIKPTVRRNRKPILVFSSILAARSGDRYKSRRAD